MGGGKVTPDDEPPPPQNKAGEVIKKHERYSLKTGDTQEAAHMQTAAGGEHGQLDRSGDSTWREAGPPEGRRGRRGAQNASGEENVFRGDTAATRPPHSHRRRAAPGGPVFLVQSKEGPGAPASFKEKPASLRSSTLSGSFLNATTPTP